MACKLCEERGKTWNGDDPRCAFEAGRFNRDNWNCATMNRLREIADRLETNMRDDLECASIGYVPYVPQSDDDEDYSGYIVMTWYKDRGSTGNAVVMFDDEPIRELTEEMAMSAIKWCENVWKSF